MARRGFLSWYGFKPSCSDMPRDQDCVRHLQESPDIRLRFSRADGSSWNHKDRQGLQLLWLVSAALVIGVTGALVMLTAIPARSAGVAVAGLVVLLVGVALGLIARGLVGRDRIRLLYALSVFVTKSKRTAAFMDADSEPVSAELRDRYQEIKSEVYAILENHDLPLTRDTYKGENADIGRDGVEGGEGWRIAPLSTGDVVSSVAAEYAPVLMDIVRRHGVVSSVVSVLPPRTEIPPHVGYSSMVKRLMLAIEVPVTGPCYLCVDGEKHLWREGGTMLWDDTFVHSVRNESPDRRVVVYMDVVRKTGKPWLDKLIRKTVRGVAGSPEIRKEVQETEVKKKITQNAAPEAKSSSPHGRPPP